MTLREYLDAGEATAAEVAEDLGVHQSVVYRWLAGETKPDVENAIALEKATKGRVPVQAWAKKGRAA